MVKTLYRSRELGTLPRGDRSDGDRAGAALDSLARTISTLLRPSCTAAGAAHLRARRVQRQRSEVDAGDVGPGHGPDHLPRLSAFHHARGLGRRPDLAPAPRGTARAPGRVDHRRDQLSPAGNAIGRCEASVLRRARKESELPSRGVCRAVLRGARVAYLRADATPE